MPKWGSLSLGQGMKAVAVEDWLRTRLLQQWIRRKGERDVWCRVPARDAAGMNFTLSIPSPMSGRYEDVPSNPRFSRQTEIAAILKQLEGVEPRTDGIPDSRSYGDETRRDLRPQVGRHRTSTVQSCMFEDPVLTE